MTIDQAAAYLSDRYGTDAFGLEALHQGAWSSAYGFVRSGTGYIVRFNAHTEDFVRDRLAHRYHSPDLPIPAVIEIGEAFGCHLAISERMPGRAIDSLSGEEMRDLLPSLLAMLNGLRRADVSGYSGFGQWSANGTAPFESWATALLDIRNDRPDDRDHGWRQTLQDSTLGLDAYDECYARLEALTRFAPRERYLIHGDLLNHNTHVVDNRISGVFDWGCSMYGDFLYDLASLVFWSPNNPQWSGIDFLSEGKRHFDRTGIEIPDFDERIRLCFLHIGLAHISYKAWLQQFDAAERLTKRTLRLTM